MTISAAISSGFISLSARALGDGKVNRQPENIPAAEIEYPFNRSMQDAPAGTQGMACIRITDGHPSVAAQEALGAPNLDTWTLGYLLPVSVALTGAQTLVNG